MIDLDGCLAELERAALLPDDTVAVCCVGSVARGWANDRSDVDFAVITERPRPADDSPTLSVPVEPSTVPVHVTQVGDRRWELKYWADGQVEQMIAKVDPGAFHHGALTAKALSEVEELFLERLLTCVPLRGHSWVAGRRRTIRDSAFRPCVVTRSLAESDNAIEDALGQLASGDVHSAVLSARNAWGYTVDALLESHGVFGSCTPKWRARRFLEAAPAAVSFERYWRLETMADFRDDRASEWVLSTLAVCRDVEMEIEI